MNTASATLDSNETQQGSQVLRILEVLLFPLEFSSADNRSFYSITSQTSFDKEKLFFSASLTVLVVGL